MWKLFLLFTLIPAVEMILLLKLAEVMGAWETVLMLLVSGSLGAWLAKREGLGVLRTIQAELGHGLPPGDRIVEGLLVLVGAVLLVTPGVVTDLVAFFLILPPSRRLLAPRIKAWAMKRLLAQEGAAASSFMGAKVTVGTPRTRDPLRRPGEATGRSADVFAHPVSEPEPVEPGPEREEEPP